MATVYLAVVEGPEGLGFSKLVVVKCLRREFVDDPEFVTMLVDEARLAARLNHPNAVQSYEIGEVDGQYFIAMEYLDGQPLSRIQGRAKKTQEPLPLTYSLSILADVLAGLHHAHSLRDYDGSPLAVVHRDVTPQNVFVTYEGQVKIVDFGIAKASGRGHQTKDGILKGKIVYMAPEQASLLDVDRRADIFSVGAMMWEALTGSRMWSGSELSIMKRLVSGEMPPAPSAVNASVDPKLDAICQKALAWNREDRYATAEEMGNELIAFLDERGERPVARDVGAVVAEMFAKHRQQLSEVIDSQLAHLQARTNGSAFRIRTVATASGAHDRLSSGKLAVADSALSAREEPSDATAISVSKRQPAPEPRPRAGRWVAALGGAVAALGAGALAVQTFASGRLPPPPAPPPEQALGPPTLSSVTLPRARGGSEGQPDEERKILVALTSSAPSASFRIDDGAAVRAPFTTRVPSDDAAHVIVATAPGYEPEEREVRFTSDVVATFELRKRATDTTRSKRATVSGGARRAGPATVREGTADVVAASPSPVIVPAVARGEPAVRPQRVIDEDNPYAK